MAKNTFRIAIRKFDPFEKHIEHAWKSFCEQTSCPLKLEAVSLDLHPLHEGILKKGGLKHGEFDAGFIVTDWMAEAHQQGALLDLNPFLDQRPLEDYPSGWADSLLRFQQMEGQVLGIPFHDGPETLIYRTDLLGGTGQPKVPETWEEFQSVARRLSDEKNNLWGTAFAAYPDGHNTVYDFCLQLWTRGGTLTDAEGNFTLNTRAAADGLNYYREILRDTGAVHPESRKFDSVESGLAFARGEIAFMVNWFGFAAMSETIDESRVKGKVGVAPLPSAPEGNPASLNVYWLLSIGAGTDHPGVAWDFLRFCASSQQDKALTLGGGIGCRQSTWTDPEVNQSIPFYKELPHIHQFARELPRRADWNAVATIIDALVMKAVDGNDSVETLLQDAQNLVTQP